MVIVKAHFIHFRLPTDHFNIRNFECANSNTTRKKYNHFSVRFKPLMIRTIRQINSLRGGFNAENW